MSTRLPRKDSFEERDKRKTANKSNLEETAMRGEENLNRALYPQRNKKSLHQREQFIIQELRVKIQRKKEAREKGEDKNKV